MKKSWKLFTYSALILGALSIGATETVSAQEWTARKPEDIQITDISNYTIIWGDTLWAISEASGVSIDTLVEINNIANRDLIFAGNTLTIDGDTITVTEQNSERTSFVEEEDTVTSTEDHVGVETPTVEEPKIETNLDDADDKGNFSIVNQNESAKSNGSEISGAPVISETPKKPTTPEEPKEPEIPVEPEIPEVPEEPEENIADYKVILDLDQMSYDGSTFVGPHAYPNSGMFLFRVGRHEDGIDRIAIIFSDGMSAGAIGFLPLDGGVTEFSDEYLTGTDETFTVHFKTIGTYKNEEIDEPEIPETPEHIEKVEEYIEYVETNIEDKMFVSYENNILRFSGTAPVEGSKPGRFTHYDRSDLLESVEAIETYFEELGYIVKREVGFENIDVLIYK